jgi:DNA-binding NarL/FixJ family response regulator
MDFDSDPGPTGGVRANGLARWDPSRGVLERFPGGRPHKERRARHRVCPGPRGQRLDRPQSGGILRYREGRFQTIPPGSRTWVTALYADRQWPPVGCREPGGDRIDDPAAAQPRMVDLHRDRTAFPATWWCVSPRISWAGSIWGPGTAWTASILARVPHVRHYTNADGLARGGVLAAFCDRHGVLWFGTREGLSRLEPEPEQRQPAPPVLVSGLRIRGAPYPISALGETSLTGIELSSDRNQVGLEFVGLGFGAGGALRYQYRLDGTDFDWSLETDQRTVNYANLSPGSYRWQVRALTSDGIASPSATVAFTILAPVWQRWWMRLLMLLAVSSLLYSVYRYRMARLLEVERLRTRIATDLHDDIGSTLSQIALLSEVAQRRPAAEEREEPLADIANLSRELVDSMSDIVWAIDPEQDRLGDLTHRMRRFASDLFSHNGSRVRLDVPGEDQNPHIGADIRRQVFLIFKESLHNTARHAGCTEVDLKLAWPTGGWNYPSRTTAEASIYSTPATDMAWLACAGGPRIWVASLVVESAPGRGTTVRLRAPLARPSAPFWKRSPHTWVVDSRLIRRMMKGALESQAGLPCHVQHCCAQSRDRRRPAQDPGIAAHSNRRHRRFPLYRGVRIHGGRTGEDRRRSSGCGTGGYRPAGMNGVDGIRALKKSYPGLTVLMLTVYDDDKRIFDALCAGACGYLLKKTPPARLLECLQEAAGGGRRCRPKWRVAWCPCSARSVRRRRPATS